VAIVAEHFGRDGVLRTHPLDREHACVLTRTVDVPAGTQTQLVLDVSHDARGDWRLVVLADGKKLHDAVIGPSSTTAGWTEISLDLSPFAGRQVKLELLNQANDWHWEFGYWGRVEVVSR
jgi:hypothetical protein